MSYPSERTTFVSRYADGDALKLEGRVCPSPILPMAMPVASRSPVSSPSWDISSESSAESGFVPGVSTAEPIPEQIGFGGMYYDHLQQGHMHQRWEFADPVHGHGPPPRALEHSADVPVVSSSHVVGSRGEYTRPSHGHGHDEISYTDEANTKLSNRIRRRCFNCKATETSTWRRSVLSPGKLLCNKCGLFERTHNMSRPKKFPRRRTHNSKALSLHSDMRSPHGSSFDNRHAKDAHSPTLPITTHLLHALDPISGEIFPQQMPWNAPDGPETTSARVGRCYTATTEQAAMYHANANGQLPSTALPGTIWI